MDVWLTLYTRLGSINVGIYYRYLTLCGGLHTKHYFILIFMQLGIVYTQGLKHAYGDLKS